jgi:hypothetical protein
MSRASLMTHFGETGFPPKWVQTNEVRCWKQASSAGCAQAKASVELDAPTRPESLFKPFQGLWLRPDINEGAFH